MASTKKNKMKKTADADSQKTGEKQRGDFPVVGIGASAGGLAAFESFFSGMPADSDPGMAFILIQHLSPDYKSILTELVRRYTRMQVFEVKDGMPVQPNCVYIIPPNNDMAFQNGSLQLTKPSLPRGQRLPIDFFFRSLAQDQRERAICIILSGTGSDGTLGLRAIKGEGGMSMVQTPGSTEYNGMPNSAIATGLVDYELSPAEMPARLIAYAAHAFNSALLPVTAPDAEEENALKEVFVLLQEQVGHDFSQYKPSTIRRRIERRMAVHQIKMLDRYIKYLRQTPAEVKALFQDLLIGVTKFFRDTEAFSVLEKQFIQKLFADKSGDPAIRVWVPGCSTGEEAYSIAILLQEQMEEIKKSFKVLIYATDIDSQAIIASRRGCYPASIATDISKERLSRFFTFDSVSNVYRINKSIRDMLIFSEHDVIKDPPFSKLNFISCRNLMIYMGEALQKKLIPLFHYALNPGGILFLGNSETVGGFCNLFTALDRKSKLYQRKEDSHGIQRMNLARFLPAMTAMNTATAPTVEKTASSKKLSLRELTEQALLQQIVHACALVNQDGDILYIHGRTGMYLEPAMGETGINNILKMAREGLRCELTTALHKVTETKEIVHRTGLRVKTNGHFSSVNLIIRPLATASSPISDALYLVILEEEHAQGSQNGLKLVHKKARHATETDASGKDAEICCIESLKHELRIKEEYLQTANEELETSNEELKSTNEELQSTNEELQSTNEELETSKEELQSTNEELSTVNAELQMKVTELSRANNDMNNLLAGTGIGTIFVDHQLHILRFTPTASKIINLIPSDVGRSIGHLLSNLIGYSSLAVDAQTVLDTLIPKETEVRTTDGRCYAMRIQPYRTLENIIEGAVFTFFDITEIVAAREVLRKANDLFRLAVTVRDAQDAIIVQDLNGRILVWNPAAEKMYGWNETEALLMNTRDRIPAKLRDTAFSEILQLCRAVILKPHRTQRITKDGKIMEVFLTTTPLVNETGQIYAIATTERGR